MGDDLEQHVARVRSMPHVQAWIRKFKALSKAMPKEISVFVASGTPTILVNGDDGRVVPGPHRGSHGDSADSRTNIDLVQGGRWDGGDW